MVVTQETKNEERLPINIGCDIGQIHDPTAVCVTEVSQVNTGIVRITGPQTLGHYDVKGNWIPPTGSEPVMRTEYTVKFIKRLPLNTPYHAVAEYIANMLENDLFANRNIRVLLDVTGVGRPVYDSLKQKISLRMNNSVLEAQFVRGIYYLDAGPKWQVGRYTLQLKPITFSGGEKYNRRTGVMAKAFLVSKLQSILQEKRFHAPDIPEVKAMCEELMVYEIKVSDEGKDTYGASTGKHDDLATAAGLSCLEDPYSEKVSYSRRVF
jgi:hypothetical protein